MPLDGLANTGVTSRPFAPLHVYPSGNNSNDGLIENRCTRLDVSKRPLISATATASASSAPWEVLTDLVRGIP